MEVKKIIKKISSISMGVLLAGSTLLGAAALDLNTYPNIFFNDGNFNSVLVIGKNANAIDTIGVTNLVIGLQESNINKKSALSESSGIDSSISSGIKIEKSSTNFEIWKDIEDLIPSIDETDLPTVLAKGVYTESEGSTDNKEDYTQTINFMSGTGTFVSSQDEDYAPQAGPYILFDKNEVAYEYILEFDDVVDYVDEADIESSNIEIQGKKYTISNVDLDSSDKVEKIKLIAGDSVLWLNQDQEEIKTIDGTKHTIKMKDVTENEGACGLEVDGSKIWIDVDDTETVSGLTIGVIEAKAVHSGEAEEEDVCKLYLGASKIVLEEGKEIEIEGQEIEGTEVTFDISGSNVGNEWEGIKITWEPKVDEYLDKEEELVDPIFGAFKIVFAGENSEKEEIELSSAADNGELKFMNTDGKEIIIPLYAYDSNSTVAGLDSVGIGLDDDTNEIYYYNSATLAKTTCYSTDVTDCEGSRWIVEFDHEAHILEISDIDLNNNKIDFEDITYDTTDVDNDLNNVTFAVVNNVYISGLGTIGVKINTTHIQLSNIGSVDNIESENGATLTIQEKDRTNGLVNDLFITWTEDDDTTHFVTGLGLLTVPSSINVSLSVNLDEEIEMDDPEIRTPYYGVGGLEALWKQVGGTTKDYNPEQDHIQVSSTFRGTGVGFDTDDKNLAVILYPKEKALADAYISPVDAKISVDSSNDDDDSTEYELNKIPSTAIKFDSDIKDMKSVNIISIGGPCSNSITAALLNTQGACYEGFSAGVGMAKLIENGDKIAMVIAGGEGQDTLDMVKAINKPSNSGIKLTGMAIEHKFREVAPSQTTATPSTETNVDTTTTQSEITESAAQPEETAKVDYSATCKGGSEVEGEFVVEVKKWGITSGKSSLPSIKMDGTSGVLTFTRFEPYEAKVGVDWAQYIAHIVKGSDCSGEEVAKITFKWVEGDETKEEEFVVPEPGCYCLKVNQEDISVDSATITMTSHEGKFTMPFYTN